MALVKVDVKNSSWCHCCWGCFLIHLLLLLTPATVRTMGVPYRLAMKGTRQRMNGCLPEISDRAVRSQCLLTGIQMVKNKLDAVQLLMMLFLSNEESWHQTNLQRCDKTKDSHPMWSGHRADRRESSTEQSTHKKWGQCKCNQRNHFQAEDVHKMWSWNVVRWVSPWF